jgi:hypothetical protein
VKDLKNFFSGLNVLSFFVETEFSNTELPNFGNIFIEFDRNTGAELALMRSGEMLTSCTGSTSQQIDVDEVIEEQSVWIKSFGVCLDGSVSILDRLKTLQSMIPLEYLSLNLEAVISHWHPITASMTHFHLKSQSKKNNKISTALQSSSFNLKDRFIHMSNNILLDEIFLTDFIFSTPPFTFSTTSTSSNSGCSHSNVQVDPFIEETVRILKCIIPMRDRYFLLSNSHTILKSVDDIKKSFSIEFEIEHYILAHQHLSRWIHIFRIILAELWSLKYTYSM